MNIKEEIGVVGSHNLMLEEIEGVKKRLSGMSSICFGLCDEIIVYMTELEKKVEKLEKITNIDYQSVTTPEMIYLHLEKDAFLEERM